MSRDDEDAPRRSYYNRPVRQKDLEPPPLPRQSWPVDDEPDDDDGPIYRRRPRPGPTKPNMALRLIVAGIGCLLGLTAMWATGQAIQRTQQQNNLAPAQFAFEEERPPAPPVIAEPLPKVKWVPDPQQPEIVFGPPPVAVNPQPNPNTLILFTLLKSHLQDYALAHRNRLPDGPDDLPGFKLAYPHLHTRLEIKEVEVFWGANANRLYWAHVKDIATKGGLALKFNGQSVELDAASFAKHRDDPLPEAPARKSAVPEKSRQTFAVMEIQRILREVAAKNDGLIPQNFEEFPLFMMQSRPENLQAVRDGMVVVRWGRHYDKGLTVFGRDFSTQGGTCVYDGLPKLVREKDAAKFVADN